MLWSESILRGNNESTNLKYIKMVYDIVYGQYFVNGKLVSSPTFWETYWGEKEI